MARNGSGTMSVENAFVADTTISSADMNENFTDIASEITNSLPRDGQAAMTGQLKSSSGTLAAPGMAFSSSTGLGFRRSAGDTMKMVAAGADVAEVTSSGITMESGKTFTVGGVSIVAMPVGMMVPYVATTAPSGWVRGNGRTIGNASSGGTERANADTADLFSLLWSAYSNSILAIEDSAGAASTRGADAATDYAADKRLPLPDMRGRGFFGLDDMGASAASRLGTVITDETTNGASGGTETHTLSAGEMPSHTHTGTTASSGDHTHDAANVLTSAGVSASSGGASGLLGSTTTRETTTDGAHTHTFTTASAGSGTAHSNMPPAWLGTFIIKL